jgi:hypothetical protein
MPVTDALQSKKVQNQAGADRGIRFADLLAPGHCHA